MSEGVLTDKQLKSASSVAHKPDTKSRKTENIIRYVTSQAPTKKASLKTSCPEK